MSFIGRLFGGLITGAIAGIIALFVGGSLFVAFGAGPGSGPTAFFVVLALCVLLGVLAERARYAWGRGFLVAGLLSFVAPIATFFFSARLTVDAVSTGVSQAERGGAALGGALGTFVATGLSAFLAFFVGMIFLVMAYFLLRSPR